METKKKEQSLPVGICMTFPISSDSVSHIDDKGVDVWKINCESPSKVGIANRDEYRPDLRKSSTIKDKFSLRIPSFLDNHFSSIYAGKGSMHIYLRDEFMKEHRDARLPDLEVVEDNETRKFRHIMTMVVTDSIFEMKVNSKRIENVPFLGYNNEKKYGVLFSLDCLHEISSVVECRRSFTFPIYGSYEPYRLFRNPQDRSVNIFDEVIRRIEQEDPFDTDLACLEGYVKILGPEAQNIIQKVRSSNGEYIPGFNEKSFVFPTTTSFEIEYTTSDGILHCEKVTDELKIPSAKDIVFRRDKKDPRVEAFETLKNMALEQKKYAQDSYIKISVEKAETLPENLKDQIPSCPFVIVLRGKYFADSTINELIPYDGEIYNFLVQKCKRNVVFSPHVNYPDEERILFFSKGKFHNDKFYMKNELDLVDKLHIEFDDSGGYDPQYNRVCGIFIVG